MILNLWITSNIIQAQCKSKTKLTKGVYVLFKGGICAFSDDSRINIYDEI